VYAVISISEIKDWATVVGVSIGLCTLMFAAYNSWLTLKTTRARFWLDIRDHFSRFDSIHVKLRPRGDWADGGPGSEEDWALVEAYMGLFEHCELMLRDGLLDARTFSGIYKYRVKMILDNKTIVQRKLVEQEKDWANFLSLVKRFQLPDPRGPRPK